MYRSGTYVVTWTGVIDVSIYGSILRASGTNIPHIPIYINPKRIEFTVPVWEEASDFSVFMDISNNTLSTLADPGRVYMYHIDDEADFLSGQLLTDIARDNLSRADIVRFMEIMGTNFSPAQYASDYENPGDIWNGRIPLEYIGRV
jgi:hypothetical protein